MDEGSSLNCPLVNSRLKPLNYEANGIEAGLRAVKRVPSFSGCMFAGLSCGVTHKAGQRAASPDASRGRNMEERKRDGQRVHVESNHWQRFQEAYRPQQCGSRSGIEGCSYSLRVRQWSSLRDGRRATKWNDMGQLFQVLTIRKQLRLLRIEGIVS